MAKDCDHDGCTQAQHSRCYIAFTSVVLISVCIGYNSFTSVGYPQHFYLYSLPANRPLDKNPQPRLTWLYLWPLYDIYTNIGKHLNQPVPTRRRFCKRRQSVVHFGSIQGCGGGVVTFKSEHSCTAIVQSRHAAVSGLGPGGIWKSDRVRKGPGFWSSEKSTALTVIIVDNGYIHVYKLGIAHGEYDISVHIL